MVSAVLLCPLTPSLVCLTLNIFNRFKSTSLDEVITESSSVSSSPLRIELRFLLRRYDDDLTRAFHLDS